MQTKKLVKKAEALERRSLTDFCLTALTEATRATISRHETLLLSERDRRVFFDALVHGPKPSARLPFAFRSAKERIVCQVMAEEMRFRLEPLGKHHDRAE